jgi:hypothetical protein
MALLLSRSRETRDSHACLLGVLAIGLAGCALVWLLGWLSPSVTPAGAQHLQPAQGFCAFRAITVTAEGLRISDTHPSGAVGRTVYFADTNVDPGVLVFTIALTDFPDDAPCYIWSSSTSNQTAYFPRIITRTAPTTELTHTVDAAHDLSPVELVSSHVLTGSLEISTSHRVVLTLTRDVAPPVSSVTSPVRAVPTGSPIPLKWRATDAGCGVLSTTLYYARVAGTVGAIDLTTTEGSMSFDPPVVPSTESVTYFFATQATDHVFNRELLAGPDVWVTVHPHRIYLPLVTRDYPPTPEMGSVTIAGGSDRVYHTTVTLALSDTFAGGVDTVAWMRLSNESVLWGEDDWEPFSPVRTWQLASGRSDLRTVYAQFKGSRGGVSTAPVSDTVYLSLNGDFEYGSLKPGWRGAQNPLPVSIVQSVQERTGGSIPPFDGDNAVLLGSLDYACAPHGVPLGYAGIAQTFSLPPSVKGKLTFRYIIWSQDASIGDAYDRFEVTVNGNLLFSDGNQVNKGLNCDQWWRVPGPKNPRYGQVDGWAIGEIDLGSYAGQDVVIAFRNYNRYDGWYNTYTYVDGVTIEPVQGGWWER